jgi:S1-C subfamily serine protease
VGLGLSAAIFAGVFGALETKDWFDARHNQSSIFGARENDGMIRTVSSDTIAGAGFDFRAASKKVMPSVVSIDRMELVQGYFDEQASERTTGSGSGVILSSDGVIVTNNHVVQGASEVKVRLPNHQSYTAKVLGTDPRADLAVIKINTTGLTPIELGASGNLEVGEWVMAVGNPLGFDNTVSVGVVSSLKRSLPVGNGVLLDSIQTDAAINPGNSGGALTDAEGKLIGINAAIASPTQASVGIGFAIPVDRVKEVVSDIVKFGHARYAGLGIRYNPNWGGEFLSDPQVRHELADLTGSSEIPRAGVIVKSPYRDEPSVEPGGPADAAGIKEWDVILAIDGQPVTDMVTLNQVLTPLKPGQTVSIKYWSHGQTKSAKVKLEELGSHI